MRKASAAAVLLIFLWFLSSRTKPHYDPDIGELVVPASPAAKGHAPEKSKWWKLLQAGINEGKNRIETAASTLKDKARDTVKDKVQELGNKVGVGEDIRKILEMNDEHFFLLGRACARRLDSENKVIELPDPRAVRLSAIVSPHADEDGIKLSVKLYDARQQTHLLCQMAACASILDCFQSPMTMSCVVCWDTSWATS
jgi:hypothetical protein